MSIYKRGNPFIYTTTPAVFPQEMDSSLQRATERMCVRELRFRNREEENGGNHGAEMLSEPASVPTNTMCHEFRTNVRGKGASKGHTKLMLPGRRDT